MSNVAPENRVFLFLQGPHGPFFYRLAKMLRYAGSQVWRVGFNAADRAFWPDPVSYMPYTGPKEDWSATLTMWLADLGVTDIVLYGDVRPHHATAVAVAKAARVRVHVFEEGYMRPYWVTYERNGANGHSRLMDMSVAEMQTALARCDTEAPLPPAHWGDTRHHIFYGALYHWFVMFRNTAYPHSNPHRARSVADEFSAYLKSLLLLPTHAVQRAIATRRIRESGFPYHLCLLQLEHDSAFQAHCPFETVRDFLEVVIQGFAKGAPGHHHLIIKAHPLDDGRANLSAHARDLAAQFGVSQRVHYVRGGKLARLLDDARTAVTVNSTAGQQVLWRGIPIKTFGHAVYAKPEFVSTQALPAFFAQPDRPDCRAYKDYRRYLLETSQVPGGFYSARGRRRLLRHVVDLMLLAEDPYDALVAGTAAPRQHLRAVT